MNALDGSRTTLAEILQQHGIATAGFVDGAYGGSVFGMAQGFDTFQDGPTLGLRWTSAALLDWLDRTRPPQFFAYVHAMHVHSPYAAPTGPAPTSLPEADRARLASEVAEEQARWASVPFDPGYAGPANGSALYLQGLRTSGPPAPRDLQHLVALYDQGVRYTDGWIGELVDGLAQRGLLENTIVVVTADHGEEFFEHGGIEHTRTHYQELSHVPLVFHGPGIPAGRVVETPVGLVDLFPTLLQLMGVPWDGVVQGRSLVPLLARDAAEPWPLFLEGSQYPGLQGVQLGTRKYLRDSMGKEQLYDLAADPGERTNRCAKGGDPACATLRAMLDEHERDTARLRTQLNLPPPPVAPVNPALRERLRQLGYAH